MDLVDVAKAPVRVRFIGVPEDNRTYMDVRKMIIEDRAFKRTQELFPALPSGCPAYIPDVDHITAWMNSMIEYRFMIGATDEFNAREYRKTLESFSSDIGHLHTLNTSGSFIFDNKSGGFIGKRPDFKFEWGYDGENYVKYEHKAFNTKNRLCLVTSYTKLMLNKPTLDRIKDLELKRPPVIEWVNGVPGCEKTTYIMRNHSKPTKFLAADLVLTASKESNNIMRSRAKNDGVDDKSVKEHYRTIGSWLMHGPGQGFTGTYDTIYVDEALMVHAGAVAFCAVQAGCKKLVMLGDTHQIQFIDREHVIPLHFENPMCYAGVTRQLEVTYRCPIDVAHSLKSVYTGIRTKNLVAISMKVRPFSGTSIPNTRDVPWK